MVPKVFRFALGVALIPVPIGFTIAFIEQLAGIRQFSTAAIAFHLGVTAYLAFHILILAPSRAYIFGHELMHAAATWISAGKVSQLKAGATQGSVVTNKLTPLIALAPYLVPIYSILWATLFGLASLFFNVNPWSFWFYFGLGASVAFHLVFTITALRQKQSDLEVLGPLLSLEVVYWANLTLVIGVMAFLVAEVGFQAYLLDGLKEARVLYQRIVTQLFL